MTVRRVMGTEVEYGVSVPGQPGANAMLLSSQIVNGYGGRPDVPRNRRARWDFEEESPLRDARGFDLGSALGPEYLEAEDDAGMANVILTNGARLYVDHAHPEYSTPEVTNPLDVVRWDKAGERVMAEAARRAATIPGTQPIHLYKNNTDNKGQSYGSHENYLMSRATPFADIVRHLTPFFVSRQVVAGQGRVGVGQDGRGEGFQLSQRADFFEVEVGLETTLKRPIINTRDEPHADAERYRRLHVIIGDANLSETSTYLKLGTTSLVLAMIEDKFLTVDLSVEEPVSSLRTVSHDPALKREVRQELILDHLQHDRRGPDLQERRDLAHVRVADDHVEPAILVRVGVRLVARVDDRPLERGLQADLRLEEVRTLRQLIRRPASLVPCGFRSDLAGTRVHLSGHEEGREIAHDVAERRGAVHQVVLVRAVGVALAVAVVLVDGQAWAARQFADHLVQRTLQHPFACLVVDHQLAWRDALGRRVFGVRVVHVVARAVRQDHVREAEVLVAPLASGHRLEPARVAQR